MAHDRHLLSLSRSWRRPHTRTCIYKRGVVLYVTGFASQSTRTSCFASYHSVARGLLFEAWRPQFFCAQACGSSSFSSSSESRVRFHRGAVLSKFDASDGLRRRPHECGVAKGDKAQHHRCDALDIGTIGEPIVKWKYRILRHYPPYDQSLPSQSQSLPKSTARGPERCLLSSERKILPKVLVELDRHAYPTASQARKACRHEGIILFRQSRRCLDDLGQEEDTEEERAKHSAHMDLVENVPHELTGSGWSAFLGTRSTVVHPDDVIAVQTRIQDGHYPAASTGYVRPPLFLRLAATTGTGTSEGYGLPTSVPAVIYQDDAIAVVDKPENLTTIGGGEAARRSDLQSALPFILRPPPSNVDAPLRLPRPVHRLDRRTSGLVLVAKTGRAMAEASRSFADRSVKKSYVALVLGRPCKATATMMERTEAATRDRSPGLARGTSTISSRVLEFNDCRDVDVTSSRNRRSQPEEADGGRTWNLIDYPIDGKEAQTQWRVVAQKATRWADLFSSDPRQSDQLHPPGGTSTTTTKLFSLLELRPLTGRYHQIRRHLSYCLGCPIVGDSKYDGGGELAKSLRERGMFLCSNGIEFPYPFFNARNTTVSERSEFGCTALLDTSGSTPKTCDRPLGLTARWKILEPDDEQSACMMQVTVPLPKKFLDTIETFEPV